MPKIFEGYSQNEAKGYVIGEGCTETGCGPWIKCLACNRYSFHPQDIEERYCGGCHKFHDGNPALEVAS